MLIFSSGVDLGRAVRLYGPKSENHESLPPNAKTSRMHMTWHAIAYTMACNVICQGKPLHLPWHLPWHAKAHAKVYAVAYAKAYAMA